MKLDGNLLIWQNSTTYRSLCNLKQSSLSWHKYSVTRLKRFNLEQGLADSYVFGFFKAGSVLLQFYTLMSFFWYAVRRYVTSVVKNWEKMYINNVGELRWYTGCHCCLDQITGYLTTSQQVITEKTMKQLGVTVSGTPNIRPMSFFRSSTRRMNLMECDHSPLWFGI